MIKGLRHRGLKRLYERGDASGIRPDPLARVRAFLAQLDASQTEGMSLPGLRLHPLRGDLKGFWAVTVRANWRIVFRFEDGHAYDVDLTDYH